MYVFAWIANVLTFIYKLPQMYTLFKVKNTTGLSLYSFCIQVVSYILYILHGVINNDPSLSIGMIPALCQNIILILMYLYYDKPNDIPYIPKHGVQHVSK